MQVQTLPCIAIQFRRSSKYPCRWTAHEGAERRWDLPILRVERIDLRMRSRYEADQMCGRGLQALISHRRILHEVTMERPSEYENWPHWAKAAQENMERCGLDADQLVTRAVLLGMEVREWKRKGLNITMHDDIKFIAGE